MAAEAPQAADSGSGNVPAAPAASADIVLFDARFPDALQPLADAAARAAGCELVCDWGLITREGDEAAAKRARVRGLLVHLHPTVDAAVLAALPNLTVVSNFGAGCDHIVAADATAGGVPVGNTPGAMATTTADLAFALLLAQARKVVEGHAIATSPETMGFDANWFGAEVSDATLGIVGMGQIGRNVAKRALGFDMRVLYHNRRPVDDEVEASLRAEYCSTLDELLAASDFVVLACPCTAETEGMIGSDQLGRMKRTAILVNVGRGKLVDQAALVEALRSRSIAGCATDVTDPEPLPRDHPLLKCPNITITPHVGSATLAARTRMMRMACANLTAGLSGAALPTPINEVSAEARRGRLAGLNDPGVGAGAGAGAGAAGSAPHIEL